MRTKLSNTESFMLKMLCREREPSRHSLFDNFIRPHHVCVCVFGSFRCVINDVRLLELAETLPNFACKSFESSTVMANFNQPLTRGAR